MLSSLRFSLFFGKDLNSPDTIHHVQRNMHISVCLWVASWRGFTPSLWPPTRHNVWKPVERSCPSHGREQDLLLLQTGGLVWPARSQIMKPNKIKQNIERLLQAKKCVSSIFCYGPPVSISAYGKPWTGTSTMLCNLRQAKDRCWFLLSSENFSHCVHLPFIEKKKIPLKGFTTSTIH